MHNNSPYKNGFTLVEIIASIALLAMVIAVMLPVFPQLMNWSSQSEDQLATSNLLGRVAADVENSDVSFDMSIVEPCGNGDLTEIESNYEVGNDYHAEIKMCREEGVDLFRTKIRILTPEGTRHSETYTYIDPDKAGEGDETSEE